MYYKSHDRCDRRRRWIFTRTFESFPYTVAAKTGTAQRTGFISTEEESSYLKRNLHLIAPDLTYAQVQAEAQRFLTEKYPDFYTSETTAQRRAVINLSKNNITYRCDRCL